MSNQIEQNKPARAARQKTFRFWILAICLAIFSNLGVEAHTFHTSLTRMDYNAREKIFEVTIQLFTHDLQPLLERRLKKRVDLEKTPEVEAELRKYLAETFVLQNQAGETKSHRWVGKEFEHDTVYVHLEIPFEEETAGAKLQNTIFFESFSKQTNLVAARRGEKKIDLLFKPGDKFKEM